MNNQSISDADRVKKWSWQMDYCKARMWNPGDSYFWKQAEQAYEKSHGKPASQEQEAK